MPTNLPKGTDFTVNVKDKDSSIPKDYKIAGAIVDVKVDLNGKLKDGKYTLTLPYDKKSFKADEVDIYYYDAKKSSWIAQNGIVDIKKGTITVEVDHFSKYAVLAKDKKQQNPNEFELGYTFYEAGTKNESIMDGFKKGPANIKKDDKGNYLVSMSFNNGSMIKSFNINGNEAHATTQDIDIKVFEFPLKDLTKKYRVNVVVDVPGVYDNQKHEVDLVFDDINTKPTPTPTPKPKPTPDPGKDKGGNGKVMGSQQKGKVSDYNFFEIDYTFYKSGTKEVSIMDDFTKGSAIVREHKKNNKKHVSMTLTNADMIEYVLVNGKDVNVLKANKNEMTIEFPVKDLNQKQSVKAFINVPGLYETEHEVDLVFDMASKRKLSEKDVPEYLKKSIESGKIVKSSNRVNEKVEKTSNKINKIKDNGKSNLGVVRDVDGNITGQGDNTNGSGSNPKTAYLNMSQIVLFSSLLLLSLVPFAIKLLRRFVTSK